MKYIDADRLKAEIERRRLSNRYIDTEGYESELLEIINELQQEQPEVDLKKEIERTYYDGSVTDTSDMDHVDYENIARHFYELGRQSILQDFYNGKCKPVDKITSAWLED